MTEREIMQTLRNVKANEARWTALCRELEAKKALMYAIRPASDFSRPKVQGGQWEGNEALVAAVQCLERQLADMIHKTVQRRMQAEAILGAVEDQTDRRILELKYIERYPWWLVAREVGYSPDGCKYRKTRAFERIIKLYPLLPD